MFFKTTRFPLSATAGLAAVLVLGGCSGVGDGKSLREIRIVPVGKSIQEVHTSTRAFECFRTQLEVYGFFDNGSIAQLSAVGRDLTWSSSRPEILRVSNGDEPAPDAEGFFYVEGTLTPVAASSEPVTITANYLGLTDTIEVSIGAPTDITLAPLDPRIAPRSVQGFTLTAKLDGIETPVTSSAHFELVEENDEVATLSIAGGVPVVTGVAAGGPLTVKASFPGICATELQTSLRVADIVSLDLLHEEGFAGELIDGTSELVKVMANFGDGPEQDLTTQSAYESSNVSLVVPIVPGILLALDPGAAVDVTAIFGRVDDGDDIAEEGENPGIASNVLQLTPVAASLTGFTIAPETATIEGLRQQQFTATGVFDGGARTQPITRHVNWTALDVVDGVEAATSTVATVTSGVSASAGLALSRVNEDGVAHIKATTPATTVPEAERVKTATLTVTKIQAPEEAP